MQVGTELCQGVLHRVRGLECLASSVPRAGIEAEQGHDAIPRRLVGDAAGLVNGAAHRVTRSETPGDAIAWARVWSSGCAGML